MRVEAVTKVCTLAGHVGLKSCAVCNPTTEKTPSGIVHKAIPYGSTLHYLMGLILMYD